MTGYQSQEQTEPLQINSTTEVDCKSVRSLGSRSSASCNVIAVVCVSLASYVVFVVSSTKLLLDLRVSGCARSPFL